MFLINSCSSLVSATASSLRSKSFTTSSVPSPEVTVPFCLVPSAEFSQAPWYSLPDHLCRFRVRFVYDLSLEAFPGSLVFATSPVKLACYQISVLIARICLSYLPTSFHLDYHRQAGITFSVPPSHHKQVSEY